MSDRKRTDFTTGPFAARNFRERFGMWLAARVISEHRKELRAWEMRADAGWEEVVRLRAEKRPAPAEETR